MARAGTIFANRVAGEAEPKCGIVIVLGIARGARDTAIARITSVGAIEADRPPMSIGASGAAEDTGVVPQ